MQGSNPIDTIKVITGEEAIDAYKVLSDASRRQILHALRARRMSTSELVDFLSKQDPDKEVKPQTVRYHIKELEKCGLIAQDGYEPAGNGDSHIMQKLWRATAENVFIATGNMDELPEDTDRNLDRTLDIVGIMKELGFVLKNEQEMNSVAEDMTKRDRIRLKGLEFAKDALCAVHELDPKLYMLFRSVLSVVRLDKHDYQEYWELSRKITDTLREAYTRGKGKNPPVY
ncbi:MAG: helix-turn-helix domain-containing protein [Candidatus Thorarchaeota archaeon]